MLQSKFDSIHRNLTSIARKVYEFVPIQEAWDCSQVCGEMRRQGVSNDLRLVAGCLNSLVHTGIIAEVERGRFRRASISEKKSHPSIKLVQTVVQKEGTEMALKQESAPVVAVASVVDPIERLSTLSNRVLQAMEVLKTLAQDIDTTAIELAESAQRSDADAKKLRQLQALLKGLT